MPVNEKDRLALDASKAREGWIEGISDRCPNCGEELPAYQADVSPARGAEVSGTFDGIKEIDVLFHGKSPACGNGFAFSARYSYESGDFSAQ